jgi:hypothetical protein
MTLLEVAAAWASKAVAQSSSAVPNRVNNVFGMMVP